MKTQEKSGARHCAQTQGDIQPLIALVRRSTTASTQKRSVLLVSLNWHREGDPRIPLGQASLHAALHHAGLTVEAEAYDVGEEFSVRTVVERVAGDPPDILGIGLYAWNEPVVRELVSALRPHFHGEIVLGGPQITYQQSKILLAQYTEVDTFVRGAGELALVQIARGEDGPIEGVVRRRGPSMSSYATASLANLPSPLLTPGVMPIEHGAQMARWETARGCAYKCGFCAHDTAPGMRTVRRVSTLRLDAEVAFLVKQKVGLPC